MGSKTNSLISQQSQLAGSHSGTSTQSSDSFKSDLSQGLRTSENSQLTQQDPQNTISTATGKSSSLDYDICDFVPHSVQEELVIRLEVYVENFHFSYGHDIEYLI